MINKSLDMLRYLRACMKGRIFIKPDINMSFQRIGNEQMDSCIICMDYFYHIPELEKRKTVIYSAGIGNQINFELDILRRLGGADVELYAIDPTPQALEYLATQELPNNFHVLPYALSGTDAILEFALPQTEGWVSGSIEKVKNDERKLDFENTIKVEGKTIKSIMKELGHDRIDLLKLDIEGSEFSVLKSALMDELDIRQMCIDHHEHMFRRGNDRLTGLLNDLHQCGYSIFYTERDILKCRSFTCMKNEFIEQIIK